MKDPKSDLSFRVSGAALSDAARGPGYDRAMLSRVIERENARLFDAANRPDECVMWSADWERAMLWMLRGILHHATASLHCQRLDALDKLHPAVQWMYSPGSATYEGAEWVPLGENPSWNPREPQ